MQMVISKNWCVFEGLKVLYQCTTVQEVEEQAYAHRGNLIGS